MVTAYVALGANLGDARQALQEVIGRIEKEEGVEVVKSSSFYKTAPIDSSGPDYINAVIEVKTSLSAQVLLEVLLKIEKEFGRVRPVGIHNAPRTMDLDLLLYGNETCQSEFLVLPHPRMHERAFVLVPLCEINPLVNIPGKGPAGDFLLKVINQEIQKIGKSDEIECG